MNSYLLLPLVSCIACSALAVAVLARDQTRRASRLAAGVAGCGAWWAFCEVLWNTADDPAVVRRLVGLSAFGWMLLGPAMLHLFLELAGHRLRERRWLVPALYTLPALLAAVDATTPWIHPVVLRTSWGWGWEVSPLFVLAFAYSSGMVSVGLLFAYRQLRAFASPAEKRQMTWFFCGLLLPLVVASFTDGLAPLLGHQLPRLGAASISLLVATVGLSFHRYGYSMLAPGAFAGEILSTLREGVALLRLDGRVHSANAGMGRLLGVPPRSLEGTAIPELCDVALEQLIDPVLGRVERECSLRPRDRDPVPVSICTSVVRDKRQNAIGVVLVARDLREIESLRSRLITSSRLASVGQLAAGIAHEINNPVAYVRANLGSLRSLLEQVESKIRADGVLAAELSDGRDLIEESLDGIDRVASIVRDVKSFSHAGEAGVESVDLHVLLESVLRVAAPQLRYAGSVTRDFGDVPPVRGSSQQLQQVFLNLVMNASQAVGEGGSIRLATRRAGTRVQVEVEDDGCGIPADQLERVFDPFFTTKPVGEGVGLGLSISYQIVRNHDGQLSVESTPGVGTCFRVELPAAAE